MTALRDPSRNTRSNVILENEPQPESESTGWLIPREKNSYA